MSWLGFLYAIVAAILFGVGGSLAQFLFQQRGVGTGWLVTMRLLFAGSALLLITAARQGRQVLAVWWLGVAWGAMDWIGTLSILVTIVLLAREQTRETQAKKVT